jgi:hypothetical protein
MSWTFQQQQKTTFVSAQFLQKLASGYFSAPNIFCGAKKSPDAIFWGGNELKQKLGVFGWKIQDICGLHHSWHNLFSTFLQGSLR